MELYPKEPQKIKVGESTRFTCRATGGVPYPTVKWTRRDGQPLSSRVVEDYPGVITLQQATLEDAGQYECRGENTAGTISVTTNLEIIETPVITLYPNENTVTVTEGDEINIQCVATGKPVPTVHFDRPDAVSYDSRLPMAAAGPSQLSQATLNIFQAKREHGGTYKCTANNEAGQDIRYVQINVEPKRGDIGKLFVYKV